MTAQPRNGSRFLYGWLVVAVAFAVILIGAGTRSAPGALLLGIEADTGWSKGSIALAGAAGLLLLGLGGPGSGGLIDRFGVRRLTVGAVLLTAAGMAASALAHEIWQLVVAFGLVSGFGAGLVASSLGPIVANRWFARGRGLVVGLFGGAASAGQLIFFPVLTSISGSDGWRTAVIVLAGALGAGAVVARPVLRPAAAGGGGGP